MAKRGSPEWRENISKGTKGKRVGIKNPFYGKTHKKESLEKISKANKGKEAYNKGKKLHYEVWNKGIPWSEEMRIKISQSLIGKPNLLIREKNHYLWKGDNVGYSSLHAWVRKKLGTPSKCKHCGTTTAVKFEWANISGEYKRELTDWIRLCKACHNKYDNIADNLGDYIKKGFKRKESDERGQEKRR